MKEGGEKEQVHVVFDVDWTAGPGYFDFDTDMHTYAMCEAMSREIWSKSFFEDLKTCVFSFFLSLIPFLVIEFDILR